MARTRYLKPDFFTDEHISELSFAARLFYQGLWCHADKQGRLEDRPKQLKVLIMPYDSIDAEQLLSELCTKPFINRYEVDKKRYIQILTWDKHQSPHHTERESTIPKCPDSIIPSILSNNTSVIKDKDKDKDKDKGERSYATVKTPINNRYSGNSLLEPTPADVEEYAKSIDYKIDGEAFVAHYKKIGWKDKNGNRITHWQSCVVTWKKRDKAREREKQNGIGKELSKIEKLKDMSTCHVDGGANA